MIRQFDVAYFMVSVDDPETNKKFADQEGADFPMLSDPAKTTAFDTNRFRICGTCWASTDPRRIGD